MWRKGRERDGAPKSGLRRLFAWRMDRQPSAQVPLASSPETMLREGTVPGEGSPSEAMPGVYCARCSRPNPEGARYCSNCGAPLTRAATGSWPAAGQGAETTSIISPATGEMKIGRAHV